MKMNKEKSEKKELANRKKKIDKRKGENGRKASFQYTPKTCTIKYKEKYLLSSMAIY